MTNDESEDYAFWDGSTTVNFYYGVYYGTTMLLQGGIDYTNFEIPLAGNNAMAGVSIASSLIAISSIMHLAF